MSPRWGVDRGTASNGDTSNEEASVLSIVSFWLQILSLFAIFSSKISSAVRERCVHSFLFLPSRMQRYIFGGEPHHNIKVINLTLSRLLQAAPSLTTIGVDPFGEIPCGM